VKEENEEEGEERTNSRLVRSLRYERRRKHVLTGEEGKGRRRSTSFLAPHREGERKGEGKGKKD